VTGLSDLELAIATGHETCWWLSLIEPSETRNARHSHESKTMLPPWHERYISSSKQGADKEHNAKWTGSRRYVLTSSSSHRWTVPRSSCITLQWVRELQGSGPAIATIFFPVRRRTKWQSFHGRHQIGCLRFFKVGWNAHFRMSQLYVPLVSCSEWSQGMKSHRRPLLHRAIPSSNADVQLSRNRPNTCCLRLWNCASRIAFFLGHLIVPRGR